MEQKAYQLGKRLGEPSSEVSLTEKKKAEDALAWSRAQATGGDGSDENHRTAVEKG